MFGRISKSLGLLVIIAACTTADTPTSIRPRVASSRFVGPTVFSLANSANADIWIDSINASCASEIRGYIPPGNYTGATPGKDFNNATCGGVKNVEIVGAGSSQTHIYQNSSNATAFLVGTGALVTFDSLDFVATDTATDPPGNYGMAIKFQQAEGGGVANSTFSGWGTAAVFVQDAPNVTVQDNVINCANSSNLRGYGSAGIWFGSGSVHGFSLHGYIRGNHVSNCSYESIHLEGVSDSQITLNTITCPGFAQCSQAIVMTGRRFAQGAGSYSCSDSPASHNIVESNYIHGRFDYGILMQGNGPARYDSVRINTVDSATIHGIAVSPVRLGGPFLGYLCPFYPQQYDPTLHTGNVIKDNYIHNSGQSGVWSGGDSTTIHNNQVYYSGSHGIYYQAQYGALSANDSEHNGGDGMHLAGCNAGFVTGGYRDLGSISFNSLKFNSGWGLVYVPSDTTPGNEWFQSNGSGSMVSVSGRC